MRGLKRKEWEKGIGRRQVQGEYHPTIPLRASSTSTSHSAPPQESTLLQKKSAASGRSSIKADPCGSVFVGSTKLAPPFARARLTAHTSSTPPYPTPRGHNPSM